MAETIATPSMWLKLSTSLGDYRARGLVKHSSPPLYMPLVDDRAQGRPVRPTRPGASTSNGAVETSATRTMRAMVNKTVENPQDEVTLLKEHAKRLRETKKKIAKDLKNAQRRTRRMQRRAKTLTDEELLSVLRMRAARRDVAEVCREVDQQLQHEPCAENQENGDSTRPSELHVSCDLEGVSPGAE